MKTYVWDSYDRQGQIVPAAIAAYPAWYNARNLAWREWKDYLRFANVNDGRTPAERLSGYFASARG